MISTAMGLLGDEYEYEYEIQFAIHCRNILSLVLCPQGE
jgi:hypothetical protein